MIDEKIRARQDTGRRAEQLACEYLVGKGLSLSERNFRCRHGEIDLIMQHDGTIVFVEVRYRRHARYGSALESVTAAKQQRLIRTALHWLQQHRIGQATGTRFDVISLQPSPGSGDEIIWIQDAFQA